MWPKEFEFRFSGEEEIVQRIGGAINQRVAYMSDEQIARFVRDFRRVYKMPPTGRYELFDSGAVGFLQQVAQQVNQARAGRGKRSQQDQLFVQQGRCGLFLVNIPSLQNRALRMGYEDVPVGTLVRLVNPLRSTSQQREYGIFTFYHIALNREFAVLSPDMNHTRDVFQVPGDINNMHPSDQAQTVSIIRNWVESELINMPVYVADRGSNELRWVR